MKRISAVVVLVGCALACMLAGCGGGQSSVDENSIKGFWELDKSSQLGIEAVLNIDEENLAEFIVADGYYTGTWSVDGGEAKIVFDDAFGDTADSGEANDESTRTAKLSMSDGKLVLGSPDGSKLMFNKGNADEYYGDETATSDAANSGEAAGEESIELDDAISEIGEEEEMVEPVIEDMKAVTVSDDDTATIQITGKGTDAYGSPCFALSVKNKSNEEIQLEPVEGTFKIGDKTAEPFIDMEEGIAAGETMTVYLSFEDEVSKVEDLKNVTGEIGVYTIKESTHSVSID